MLILSRRNGESIIIDDAIKITVLESRPNRIKLGVVAPADIPVFREEIYLRTLEQKKPFDALQQTQVDDIIEPVLANTKSA